MHTLPNPSNLTQTEAGKYLETASARWKPHLITQAGRLFVLPLLWFILWASVNRYAPIALPAWVDTAWLAGTGLIALIAIHALLTVICTSYIIDRSIFRWRRGILNRYEDEIEAYRFRDFQITRPLHLRLLGLGNILLISEDVSHPTLMMLGIKNPEQCKQFVRFIAIADQKNRNYREIGH